MTIDKKVAGLGSLPPSYLEAMNLPVVRDLPVDGRSTPMAVPRSQPYQHDDWAVHANDDELRAALRDLHVGIGTPTRTASPADMCSALPAPTNRCYSPAPLLPPTRSFSPAPRSHSPAASSFRTYSPAPMDPMGTYNNGRPGMYRGRPVDDFLPPNASFLGPVMSSSPPPMHPVNMHSRSPSEPVPREAYPRQPRMGISPGSRVTHPNSSYPPIKTHDSGNGYPMRRPPPPVPSLSTWEYTSQFAYQQNAQQNAHQNGYPREPRGREREHSGATASSYSSYSSFSSGRPRGNSSASQNGRPWENSPACQNSMARSYSSTFSQPQVSPPIVSPPIVSPPALSPPALSPPALSPPPLSYSAASSSPPSFVFSTPISPPSATFAEFGAGTSPPVAPFHTQYQVRALSPHPTGSTTFGRSPTPIHEHDEELKPSPVRRHFNASPISVSTISSVGTGAPRVPPRRPRSPRFVCIMLSETNRIRGVGLPSEIRALISDSLLHGAKAGIKDFSEVMAGVVEWKIQGHPWQDAAEAPRARRIVKRILTVLSSAGWHLVTTADLSRKDKEKDTLYFREGPPVDRDFFVIGFGDQDKLSIIDPPNEGVKAEFLKAVKTWPRGVQDYGEKSTGCFEAKLFGAPWNGSTVDVTCQARLLTLSLLSAMEGEGYRLMASINLNKQRKSDTNVDVDSWIFARKVAPARQQKSIV